MNERRDAIAENLRSLASDLKNLVDSATTDPKERRKKERRWRALYGALSIVTNLAAGLGERPLDHAEVQAAGAAARQKVESLLTLWITKARALGF